MSATGAVTHKFVEVLQLHFSCIFLVKGNRGELTDKRAKSNKHVVGRGE